MAFVEVVTLIVSCDSLPVFVFGVVREFGVSCPLVDCIIVSEIELEERGSTPSDCDRYILFE